MDRNVSKALYSSFPISGLCMYKVCYFIVLREKKKEQYERERYMGKIDKIVLSVSHYRDRSRLCPFFREHMR